MHCLGWSYHDPCKMEMDAENGESKKAGCEKTAPKVVRKMIGIVETLKRSN